MGGKHDTVLPTTGFSTSVPTSKTGGSLDFEILFRAAKSGGFSVADVGPISIVVVWIVVRIVLVLISSVVVLIIVASNNSSHNNVQW